MSYELELSPEAAESYQSLEDWLKPHIIDGLRRLASDPITLSRPSVSPPYPPNYQMFAFDVPNPIQINVLHRIVILFRYMTNETTLAILGIGHQRMTV